MGSIFFILSGWLIGGLYWRERASFGDVRIFQFWIRRWMRTIPPYVAALLMSWFAVKYVRNEPFDYGYLVFIQNYYEVIPFFLVSWSLCVEEHFYLVVPLLFVFWYGKKNVNVYLLAAVALMLPAGFRLLEYPYSKVGFGYALTATHLRMEGLISGFVLSYVATNARQHFKIIQKISPYVLVFSVVLMIDLDFATPWLRYGFWGTALALFYSAALVCAVSCNEIKIGHRVITLIAVTSYSIYLTHAMAIHIARVLSMHLAGDRRVVYFPVMLAVVAASSLIFHYGVERISIRIRDAFWPRRTTIARGSVVIQNA